LDRGVNPPLIGREKEGRRCFPGEWGKDRNRMMGAGTTRALIGYEGGVTVRGIKRVSSRFIVSHGPFLLEGNGGAH